MNDAARNKVLFGDFQTPPALAEAVCRRLRDLGLAPGTVIEPTCGLGSFVQASALVFPEAEAFIGLDISEEYLAALEQAIAAAPYRNKVRLRRSDFFAEDWEAVLAAAAGVPLVLGNLPWVTNSVQSTIGGGNLPEKSNFLRYSGFEAISGKANFDISEWMLMRLLRAAAPRRCDIAILVKTLVARRVLRYAAHNELRLSGAEMFGIDAKKEFGASVDACLLLLRLSPERKAGDCDCTLYGSLDAREGRRFGYRDGIMVNDLDRFREHRRFFGKAPQKWRSGLKHDAAAVFELSGAPGDLTNAAGEEVKIEDDYLFPLMKGSDVGGDRGWRDRYVLVPQTRVGEPTDPVRLKAPKTWKYLERHRAALDSRGSVIYAKNPPFSVFGVGEYAFRPWKIAICGLYKSLGFRLVGPVGGKPVFFDDTVYYISFDNEGEAAEAMAALSSGPVRELLDSLIFWDEKRPVKASILNLVDWSGGQKMI